MKEVLSNEEVKELAANYVDEGWDENDVEIVDGQRVIHIMPNTKFSKSFLESGGVYRQKLMKTSFYSLILLILLMLLAIFFAIDNLFFGGYEPHHNWRIGYFSSACILVGTPFLIKHFCGFYFFRKLYYISEVKINSVADYKHEKYSKKLQYCEVKLLDIMNSIVSKNILLKGGKSNLLGDDRFPVIIEKSNNTSFECLIANLILENKNNN